MTLREGQNRLREISKLLKKGESLSETDQSFLSAALASIADGGNAEVALEVKAKRGERKGKNDRISQTKGSFALGWIAVAKTPVDEGGLGLTLESACAMLGENGLNRLGLTEETLRTYWNRNGACRDIEFKL